VKSAVPGITYARMLRGSVRACAYLRAQIKGLAMGWR
jgi:hypothetical protein